MAGTGKKKTVHRKTSGATAGKKTAVKKATGQTARRKQASKSAKNTGSRRKSTAKTTRKKQEPIYSQAVVDEVTLIAALAVSIVLLLSIFNLGGHVGNKVAYVMFGIFGILAYIIPFALFIGVAFHISNRGNPMARVKTEAVIVFFAMILALVNLSDPFFDGTGMLRDGFISSAASHDGGGIIGYTLSWLTFSAFGRIASTVIFVCFMLIAFVVITGKRLFVHFGQYFRGWADEAVVAFHEWREHLAEARVMRAEELAAIEDEYDDLDDLDDLEDLDGEHMPDSKPGHRRGFSNIIIPGAAREKEAEEVSSEPAAEKAVSEPATEKATSKPAANEVLPESAAEDKSVDEKEESGESADTEDGSSSTNMKEIAFSDSAEDMTAENDESEDDADSLSDLIPALSIRMGGEDVSDLSEKEPFTKEHLDTYDPGIIVEPLSFQIPDFVRSDKRYTNNNTSSRPVVQQPSDDGQVMARKNTLEDKETAADEDTPLEIAEEEVEKYEFPPIELLERGSGLSNQQSTAALKETALKLQDVFKSFGVGVQVTNISCGPSVTRYELQPDHGVKVSKIVSLTDDIKLNLAVADIRIEAPIPGKAAVGIEVPNVHKEMVHLRDLLESDKASDAKSKLVFAVGKDIGGQVMVADIEKMPHLLIAGATGSGKSVCINTIIMSILYRADPNEVKMIMIDPKVVELNVYNGLPHLLIPVVTDPKKAAGALNWAVNNMMERYNKFAEIGAKDIKSYNKKVEAVNDEGFDSEKHKKMPQIIIVIDELADLMMVAQSEVEDAICRLAQLARAAGIHLVIATQRPSVNVITGLIKANVPSRIAFSVSSGVDSRTILDMNGAEKLLGNGDMLFYPQGFQKPVRVQGAFVSESEIGRVTDFIRERMGDAPVYSEKITKSIETSASSVGMSAAAANNNDRDIYFEEAGRFVIEKEKASIGMLQRVYKIGFNRAARIMDQLCDAGVVGPEIGTKPRQVVMTREEFEQYLRDNG